MIQHLDGDVVLIVWQPLIPDDMVEYDMGKTSGTGSHCVNCGARLDSEATYCSKCGYHQRGDDFYRNRPEPPQTRPQRSPAIAVALAFLIPGLGHMYAGEWVWGFIFLIMGSIAALSTIVLIGFILYPIVWILGMIGGARAVERYNFPERA